MKDLANISLILLMMLQFYTHYALDDSFERMAPSLIFGLLLVCRLIILLQVIKKEKDEIEAINKMMSEMSEVENNDHEFTEELIKGEQISAEDKKYL